jgi:superfamily II DNA or RNA helicase
MKAVISNRIYLNCAKGSELEGKLNKALTYSISQMPVSEFPLIIRNLTRVTDSVVSIPSGREDLIPSDYEIVDKRTRAQVALPPLKATLRPSQEEAVRVLTDNGIAEAPVGFGKTLVGLGLVQKHQQKTLIITTTTTIRDMWVNEVKKWFGFTPGIVGGGKFDISTPIVVGNIQTVRLRLDKLSDVFGIVLVDEVHRSVAETFTKVLNSLKARYKFGLSGTLERKDGLHCLLQDYFGFGRFVGKVENTMIPTVHMYSTPVELSVNEFIPWANLISKIMNDKDYLNTLLMLLVSYIEMGHKVLVVCDRTQPLEWLHEQLRDKTLIITGKVTGMETRQRIMDAVTNSKTGIGLLATQSIFSEGVSLNALSAVLLATPINNEPLLVQICGRIMRLEEGKLEPVIIDIAFSGGTGKRHRLNRQATYISKGWPIIDMSSPRR